MVRAPDVWKMLIAVAMLTSIAGCATGGAGTPVTVTSAEIPKLAGTWQGAGSMPQVGAQPGTLTVTPGGTYELRMGAVVSTGKFEAKDGMLITTVTSTTGIPPEKRVSQAVLSDRGSVWVLTGYGQSDRGPFSYEFTKSK